MKIRPKDFEHLEDDIDNYGKIGSQWSDICKSCSEILDKRFKYNLEGHAIEGNWCLVGNCKHLADFYITYFK